MTEIFEGLPESVVEIVAKERVTKKTTLRL